ncbi:ABC transporter permease subunit, partial [Streptococcus suis]
VYIEIPFFFFPIFNDLDDFDKYLINASIVLGATHWQTFTKVIFPISMNGVRSGVHAVFSQSLCLFMLTSLIVGNRVSTLGTALEPH